MEPKDFVVSIPSLAALPRSPLRKTGSVWRSTPPRSARPTRIGAIMRNAKLVVLTLVTALSALGCSVRMNPRPEYAGAAVTQPQSVDTFAVPYRNSWDSNADEVVRTPARPVSVGAAAEAVKSPAANPVKRPINGKNVVEERFGLR